MREAESLFLPLREYSRWGRWPSPHWATEARAATMGVTALALLFLRFVVLNLLTHNLDARAKIFTGGFALGLVVAVFYC
jgi:hypothetical protein